MANPGSIRPLPVNDNNFHPDIISKYTPDAPFEGMVWAHLSESGLIDYVYVFHNNKWLVLSSGSGSGGSGSGSGNCTGSLPCSDTGVFGGGYYNDGSYHYVNTIDYITISTPSDATDFGDLTVARYDLSATSNGTNDRGVFGGGYYYDGSNHYFNTIDYITISTPSDATDFGDLTGVRGYLSATSNGTNDRGVFGGGHDGSSYLNTIDYITISTPSNATDFGDLTVKRYSLSATSNGTNDRGIFGGGYVDSSPHQVNTIDYITISTPSDATDFGDLTVVRNGLSATSNGTNDRGVFGGGNDGSHLNTIDYITISTPSNATDFGDLTVKKYWLSATSNGTNDRGVFGGGYDGSSYVNTIDYITISTPSDATDFGDLTIARYYLSATSNA